FGQIQLRLHRIRAHIETQAPSTPPLRERTCLTHTHASLPLPFEFGLLRVCLPAFWPASDCSSAAALRKSSTYRASAACSASNRLRSAKASYWLCAQSSASACLTLPALSSTGSSVSRRNLSRKPSQ